MYSSIKAAHSSRCFCGTLAKPKPGKSAM
jgi:hypothetical protein